MKKIIITAMVSIIVILTSCSGGSNPKNGQDTNHNTYGAKDTSKIDTSKATGGDNSGSGGTKLIKNTPRDTAKALKNKSN